MGPSRSHPIVFFMGWDEICKLWDGMGRDFFKSGMGWDEILLSLGWDGMRFLNSGMGWDGTRFF